ncbi:FeoB-associated Cys-rich membrane protein [Sphingobacterium corticibacterium]|uniref:FeoB-associated Cys-rich membrane protein n=1 Tax=Sphingobacterium corticibacterium TaxID=2484746 RepID=A0A4Q6XSD2_9SPHI|nr:FeoB-associated Cys-rich membrane protein [Sphingobacterium corticibacterium]
MQYAIIALVFIAALVFLIKRFAPSKKKQQGCNKGCGCSMTDVEKKR